MEQCNACGIKLQGAFCHECGQKHITERFTFKKVLSDAFTVVFNLEKGFFFTLKSLAQDPGKVIHGYLNGQTKKYYNPIALILILGSIAILLASYSDVYENIGTEVTNFNRMLGQDEEAIANGQKMMPYIKDFQNFIVLLMVPFIAIFTYLFYRSSGLYFAEQNIVICYASALNMISSIAFTFLYYFLPEHIGTVMIIGMLISFLIYAYVLESYFKEGWIVSIIYSTLSWIFGYIATIVFATIFGALGMIIFLIIKRQVFGM